MTNGGLGAAIPVCGPVVNLAVTFLRHMKNILVALELRADTARVLRQATELAVACHAKLWLLHVADPDPDFVGYEAGPQYIRDIRAEALKEERAKLHQIISDLTLQKVEAQPIMVMGSTAETILAEAERLNVDLIVMGTHGRRGLAKAFLGSTSDDVLRANRFSVLVVPTPSEG